MPYTDVMNDSLRSRKIYQTTVAGSVINIALVVFKFVAGILGGSAAMVADAVHSLSDLLTDAVVLLFVRLSSRPQDSDHAYGHGKYETMATTLIGVALLMVGLMICYDGLKSVWLVWSGDSLSQPGWIALVAALLSVLLKEWAYQFTASMARKIDSPALLANAWHHRSDALSSIGATVGIGGAILLGNSWVILDPLAAVVVGVMVVRTALELIGQSASELLEKSLPESTEKEITDLVLQEPLVSCVHHLRTRRIGNRIAIEMHVRMPGEICLTEAHAHASSIERRLRQRYGEATHIGIHVEPLKDKQQPSES